jgi:ammonium transporter, Amt family
LHHTKTNELTNTNFFFLFYQYFYYSLLLSGLIYPIAAHAIWSSKGFLSADHETPLFGTGVVDIAGSGVVHVLGGITAFIATYVLGPRRGRFHDEQTGELLDKPKDIQGHNISMQVRGSSFTFVLIGLLFILGGDRGNCV